MLDHCQRSWVVICHTIKSPQTQSRAPHIRQCQLGSISCRLLSPSGGKPLSFQINVSLICSTHLILVFRSVYRLCSYFFSHCLHFCYFVCVFIGTDALCWEQELHGAWSASSGGLLSVHKLLCCSSIPPHCRIRQSCPCFEETSFVSTEICSTLFWILLKMVSLPVRTSKKIF